MSDENKKKAKKNALKEMLYNAMDKTIGNDLRNKQKEKGKDRKTAKDGSFVKDRTVSLGVRG